MKRYELDRNDLWDQETEEYMTMDARRSEITNNCLRRLDLRGFYVENKKKVPIEKYNSLMATTAIIQICYYELLRRVAEKDEKFLTPQELERFLCRSALTEHRQDEMILESLEKVLE